MTGKLCTEELTNLELVVAGKPERPPGDLACYGFWDFGDAFGNDQFMCGSCGDSGNGESAKATGCTIETPACRSGKAVARRAIDVYTPWHKTPRRRPSSAYPLPGILVNIPDHRLEPSEDAGAVTFGTTVSPDPIHDVRPLRRKFRGGPCLHAGLLSNRLDDYDRAEIIIIILLAWYTPAAIKLRIQQKRRIP
ncbi:MAG TPA: hypothetical protein VGK27_04445 [Candidatus Deferrimicrobiaceae bacterium]|jgi:hypothetical protein